MKGIDISRHQGNINFDYAKNAGIEVVYMKATEGLTYDDPMLGTYYKGARAADLKIGFYHYLRANDPVLEAVHFLTVVKDLTADCLYCIDCETTQNQDKVMISSRIRRFADYLISQGKNPCVYTYENFYLNYMDSTVQNIPLWVAHYGVSAPGISGWTGFQYTDSGTLSGINTKIDLSTFKEGILARNGWYLENGIWHYYENGAMVKNRWAQDSSGKWFWLNESGDMLINGWVLWKDKWYFFGGDGAMFTSSWAYWKEKQYYLGSDGTMLISTVTPDGYRVNDTGEWDGEPRA